MSTLVATVAFWMILAYAVSAAAEQMGAANQAFGKYVRESYRDWIHADGPTGVRIAVREQIAAGADWIKVYADYRWGPDGSAQPTFTQEELKEAWRPGETENDNFDEDQMFGDLGNDWMVGGTGRDDTAYAAGSQGPTGWDQIEPWHDWPYLPGPGLIKPDVVAPAEGIASTLPGGVYSGETWGGTSMACPQAAGVAALMLQKAQDRLAESAIREVVEGARSNRQSGAVATPTMETPVSGAAGAGRLGSGDIDNLVARLAMEERQNRKAMPSRSGVYKWAVGLAAMVFLLTVIL